MQTMIRQFVAVAALAVMQMGVVSAQDETKPDPVVPTKPSRAELRDKQLDVSLEARDIERILGKLKKASELSKQRITEAAKTAEAASTSLDKGDSKAAQAEAKQTAEMFKEIARQLEALLKEEAPQQIAEARQLAQQLAKAEREFAEKFQGALNPVQATGQAKMKIDPKSKVAPMVDPKMKGQGGQTKTEAQNGNGGKNGEKNEGDKKSEKKDPDDKNPDDKSGDKKEPSKGEGDADQTGGKGNEPRKSAANGGGKPMPDGQGGTPEDKDKGDKGDDKKSGTGGQSKDEQKGDKAGEKKTEGGSGKDPKDEKNGGAGRGKEATKSDDEPPSDGAGSTKNEKDEQKAGKDQDGSGGDQPNDKSRDGSGGGSDEDARNDRGGNGSRPALTAEQLRQLVAERADKLAESGRTLQDVLNEIAKSTDPNDRDAAARIQAVIKEIDINKLVAEMGQVSNMIRSKKDDDARLSSLDAAERLEIMAQRLDAAYRGIVAPQAEELRKLEQALADLREQLDKLETPSQVATWHREARELLDKLDKLGVNLKARDEIELELKKAGFGINADRTRQPLNWGLIDGRYAAPAAYNLALVHLQEDIQERIQTLILGDLGNVSDDATPPKYQELVERYFEVLSRQGGKPGSTGKPGTQNSKTEMKPKAK